MKTIFTILTICFLTLNCSENSSVKLGKQPLDLEQNALNVSIPDFFSDEKNFEDQFNNDLFVEVEERDIDHEEGKSTSFVYYDVHNKKKKLKLAKFGSFNFENLELLADLNDEKVFLIAASEDSVTAARKDELIKTISEKYGESLKIDKLSSGDYYRWEKDNTVVKLSVESRSNSDFGGYEETQETDEEKSSKPDQFITIFILTKDFEKFMKNSYSGMDIFNDYF